MEMEEELRFVLFVFKFRPRFIVVVKVVKAKCTMSTTEGLNVVLERALMFEVRATKAIPNLATILLVGSPIAFDREGFGAFSTSERLDSMLSLVMRLEGAEVLERSGPRVVDVVFAPWRAAIAWQLKHCRWLCSF